MLSRRDELLIGLGTIVLAGLLIFYMIPQWVISPRAARSIFLSPVFWPYILAGVLMVMGALLTARAWLSGAAAADEAGEHGTRFTTAEATRLLLFAVLCVVCFIAVPIIGMVWTSIAAFVALTLLTGSTGEAAKGKAITLVTAILLPFLLYFFFTRVAGVAIPQGVFVRLP